MLAGVVACSGPMSRYDEEISRAERLMPADADSAVALLDAIDPSELTVDSLQMKYHFLRAYGHMKQNRSMIGDSLIAAVHDYYRGKDTRLADGGDAACACAARGVGVSG